MLQFVSLLGVENTEGVEVLGAADLELHNIFAPLDLYRASILPSCCEEKVLDLVNLLRL